MKEVRMPTKSLPDNPSLAHLKYQAKDLLGSHKTGNPEACSRIREFHPKFTRTSDGEIQSVRISLADAQLVVAREYGFKSWPMLKRHVQAFARSNASGSSAKPSNTPGALRLDSDCFESLARDFVSAYDSGDPPALQRLNDFYSRSFTWDDLRAEVWRQVYKVRQAKARPGSFAIEDAQWLMARDAGFGNWDAFMNAAAAGSRSPGEPYAVDSKDNVIVPRRNLSNEDWETLIAVMKEQRISGLNADGRMTDAALKKISQLCHVTHLSLGGSRQLSDGGLQHLARMPQLQHLDLSEYPGGRLTDRGLEVLRYLPNLRSFKMAWQSGISDLGVANLAFCDELESVWLMGTSTGDGAIRALAGKRKLRDLQTGKLVSNTGLQLLHQFPVFKTWQYGDLKNELRSPGAKPNQLLLDGPFSDEGLLSLAGLNGLFGLSFFWHTSALTPGGLRVLAALPRLGFLGCEGKLCDDTAMRHIAAIPGLRMLMAQGTVASDDGFEALSQSKTLESIWGRECPNLTGRGFVALSRMPFLRGLGVSCKRVDDDSLSSLPHFPSLRDLTPVDVADSGFRHIGRCENLEKLTCMYCRETTDIATGYIAGLSKLKSYYAGLTRITDQSLEVMGRMPSLERIEFYECKGVTDLGLLFLARLPHLREVELSGLPNVTLQGTKVFPAQIRVKYSV
jgi:hypothetical protein